MLRNVGSSAYWFVACRRRRKLFTSSLFLPTGDKRKETSPVFQPDFSKPISSDIRRDRHFILGPDHSVRPHSLH
jgi:hypothetical protein